MRSPPPGRTGGGVGEFFAALGDVWRLTGATSEPGSPRPCRPRWAWAGRRRHWRQSPEPTRRACGTRMRCWPPGYHRLNCPYRHHGRRGRRGAASAIRSRGCSITTAVRRAHARSADHRGPGKPMWQSISRPTLLQLGSIAVATRYYARNATQTRASPGYAAARVVNSPRIALAMHDPACSWSVHARPSPMERAPGYVGIAAARPEKARRSRED